MGITLETDKMTRAEMVEAMEILWEALSKTPETVPSPEWHGDILRQREENIASGKDNFTNWETAKKEILKSLS